MNEPGWSLEKIDTRSGFQAWEVASFVNQALADARANDQEIAFTVYTPADTAGEWAIMIGFYRYTRRSDEGGGRDRSLTA